MKIAIIGNCGSGKSTLARKISEKFNIPHIHLDHFWFEAYGNHIPRKDGTAGKEEAHAYVQGKVEALITKDSWVLDGWYPRTRFMVAEHADYIVFLDIPLWRRIINHIQRVFFGERHQGLDRWNDLKFTSEIIRRTFTQGTQMHEFVQENPDKVIHLRSYKEVNMFLKKLKELYPVD